MGPVAMNAFTSPVTQISTGAQESAFLPAQNCQQCADLTAPVGPGVSEPTQPSEPYEYSWEARHETALSCRIQRVRGDAGPGLRRDRESPGVSDRTSALWRPPNAHELLLTASWFCR